MMSTSSPNRESIFSIDSPHPQSAPPTAQTARTEGSAVSRSSSEDEDKTSEDDHDHDHDSGLEPESPSASDQEREEVASPTSSDSSGHSYSQSGQESDQVSTLNSASTRGAHDSESDEDGSLEEQDTPQTEEDSSTPSTSSSQEEKRERVGKVSTTPTNTPPASALPTTDIDDSENEGQSGSESDQQVEGRGEEQRQRERERKEEEEGARRRAERREKHRVKREAAAAAAAVKVKSAERMSSTATKGTPRRIRTPRTWQHEMVRFASLYLFPVLLIIPLSLILSLNNTLLTPLYNTLPLTLHTNALYFFYLLPPSVLYWYITLRTSAKEMFSARVCFSLAALSGDVVAVSGRRAGSLAGQILGPEWGALVARAVLGVGVVGGGTAFAQLCFDHISPIIPSVEKSDNVRNCTFILLRSAAYIFHIWLGEIMWTSALSGSTSILVQSPEKTILFISLLLTALSFFLKAGGEGPSFPTLVRNFIRTRLSISSPLRVQIERATTFLPAQIFPLLLLLRLPLLILALRQQIFLRPPTSRPYVTVNGELRIISSERSLTGQVVVAENIKKGYRFLRCDHSILGGRWIREVSDASAVGGKRTDMGDSIFATFNLQEIIVLAERAGTKESLIHTLSLTTDLEVLLEGGEEDSSPTDPDRALIIGLGAGIAATTFAKRGFAVDVVEIDPAVYKAAQNHFGLSSSLTSVNLMDGSTFISQLADLQRQSQTQSNDTDTDHEIEDEREVVPKWDYVVQDCFTGGSVPGEMFTLDFWQDLGDLLVDDGVVAMNFAGILGSKASKAVLVTLISVFPQCRAFGDGFEKEQGPNDMVNMVVICTKTLSPLLTFRAPTPKDVLRSPLRSHVYSTFHPHEIQLYDIISEDDMMNGEFLLRRGQGRKLDRWQVGTALSTWKAMQKILTPEMWLAY